MYFSTTTISSCRMLPQEIAYWLLGGETIFTHKGKLLMVLRKQDNSRVVIYIDQQDLDEVPAHIKHTIAGITRATKRFKDK